MPSYSVLSILTVRVLRVIAYPYSDIVPDLAYVLLNLQGRSD